MNRRRGFEQGRGGVTKVAAVSIDVSKAFDTVPKNALLLELQRQWSLPKPMLRLLKDYLSSRTQSVRVDGSDSKPTLVLSGVPQGSVLGGFLFCAYVNSILSLSLSAGSSAIMFSDDLILVKAVPSLRSEYDFQSDLDIIESAYKDLLLLINPSKSRLMVFSLASTLPSFEIFYCHLSKYRLHWVEYLCSMWKNLSIWDFCLTGGSTSIFMQHMLHQK